MTPLVSTAQPVLEVTDLATQFVTQDGTVHAVNGVSFTLNQGEFLAIVGESGSGKSVTMMSLVRLIPMPPGEIVSGEHCSKAKTSSRLTSSTCERFVAESPRTSPDEGY